MSHIDHKARMLFAYARIAYTISLKTGICNQFAYEMPFGALKGGPRACKFKRLLFFARTSKIVHLVANLLGRALMQRKRRGKHHQMLVFDARLAISQM